MKSVELVLLVVAYSTIIITIFISLICYKRNIEKWETIAFSVSLFLLIVAMTIPALVGGTPPLDSTNVFTLLSMILVGLTTPLSIMSERQHNIAPRWIKLLYAGSLFLFLGTGIAYFAGKLAILEYPVVFFLGISVILSMILVRMTKPQKNVAHLEKTNRIFAFAFLIIVPLSLLTYYAFSDNSYPMRIGFTLPFVFILLSLNKLIDDLQRLSLIKPVNKPTEQHFKNYLLSEREKEVATLLVEGKTYKQIAETLFISIPTVKTHTSNVYKKCKVKNKHELTMLIIS